MEFKTEKELLEALKSLIEKDCDLKVVYEPQSFLAYGLRFDAEIKRGDETVALIEHKANFRSFFASPRLDKTLRAFAKSGVQFFLLISSLRECYVYRHNIAGVMSEKIMTVQQAIDTIKRHSGIKVAAKEEDSKVIISEFLSLLGILPQICEFKDEKVKDFLANLKPEDVETDGAILSLKVEKETEFFNLLLWGDKPWQPFLTKYGTLSSLYRILNEKKLSLASIVNMNDKSEGDFLDKKMSPKIRVLYNDSVERKTNCFIISLVSKELSDRLTQWRLYGDNSKGVSVTYNMGSEKVFDCNGFYVAPICYVEIDKDSGDIKSREANLVMEMLHREFHGMPFVFKRWDAWKHFFKPEDYKVEKEYRILYYRDYITEKKPPLKWIHDGSTNIVFPVVEFYLRQEDLDKENEEKRAKYSVFPFNIEKVLLGVNMPELTTNVEELRYLAKDNLDMDLDIEASSITDYRG